jgi:3',5'-cyclic AMP phosphodiesterase CpdA
LLRRSIALSTGETGPSLVLIVQISDMHVSMPGKLYSGRIDSRAAFERAITRVLSLDPKPDLVLLSGDLAETGVPEEYDFIAEQLARLSCRVLAIPGNHDVREAMLHKLPQCVTEQDGGHLNFVADDFPVRIIGLDTIVPGQIHGEICERRLAWLDEILSKETGKRALIAMHHPPFLTGISTMDGYGIRSGLDAFKAIIAEHARKISLIVCGHAHRAITTSISGVPVLLAPSSSLQFQLDLREQGALRFVEEPQQFLVHMWSERTGLVSHAAFVDAFPGPFPVGASREKNPAT